ncbi:MAG: UvrD-helicase domain-containing protein [Gemmatimonadota bacterium]|nr:MAG: UvrD-helicase domain-containing protein [Gemmatimonadota bacterium]
MLELKLNAAQRRAVEHSGGPLMVLAGAGSGKTRVLTCRLAHLVRHRDVPPGRILAVTFTNRAADEMRGRVAQLLGRDPAGLWIGTFHSLSARLLRREAPRVGFTSQFTIYDEDDRLALIKRLLERGGYAPRSFPPRQIQAMISAAKNRLITPEELAGGAEDRLTRVAADIYHALTQALLAANAMDFDDLLLHPLTLFDEHPERLQHYQRRFDAIMVDEFQDTNRAQYLLVRHLSGAHKNVCVVGDDDQSIYSWRGADLRNMLDFQADFPSVTVVRLEENYRSTQMILNAANGVIAENRQRLGKTLFTSRQGGDAVESVAAADERDEAEWVGREIRERSAVDLYAFHDMAVLYRTNAQSRALEEALRRVSIPYRVVGAASFYERREVKDLISYLRLLVNPQDDEAFMRAVQVPKRGVGVASLAALQAAAAQWSKSLLETAAIADRIVDLRPLTKERLRDFADLMERNRRAVTDSAPAAVLERVIEEINYESHLASMGVEGMERLENVRELVAATAEWSEEADPDEPGSPLERFLAGAALTSSNDQSTGDPEGVSLMTVHTAKGLEWPVVFVTGLEDGLFPLRRALESEEDSEEERRLAYVAITRARDRVYLTWARSRRRGGQLMPGLPSRFIEAVPPEVLHERRTSGVFGGDLYRRAASHKPWTVFQEPQPEWESQDAPRFVKGERVRHRKFGSGTIAGLSGSGRDLKATVDFDDETVGVKQLLVAYAGLERDWDGA